VYRPGEPDAGTLEALNALPGLGSYSLYDYQVVSEIIQWAERHAAEEARRGKGTCWLDTELLT
jgi:hypothetical protein